MDVSIYLTETGQDLELQLGQGQTMNLSIQTGSTLRFFAEACSCHVRLHTLCPERSGSGLEAHGTRAEV